MAQDLTRRHALNIKEGLVWFLPVNLMLLLKRLLTSLVLFLVLSVALTVGTLGVIGGMVGARAAASKQATDYQSGYNIGHAAGQEIGRKYGSTVLLISLGVAAVAAVTISFTGILPWCRRKPRRPLLPT